MTLRYHFFYVNTSFLIYDKNAAKLYLHRMQQFNERLKWRMAAIFIASIFFFYR